MSALRWAGVGTLILWTAGCSGPSETTAMAAQDGVSGNVADASLQWPLPPGAEQYRDIDGRRMHRYVVEQAEISRRYRDQVHPKFWGRIIGSSADAESAEWLAEKFRAIGLSDVRIQNFDLEPQWFPQAYEVTVGSGGTTFELESGRSQPTEP